MKLINLLLLLFITLPGYSQVAVIANQSVAANEISGSEILDFYTRDVRVWDDGQTVVVFDLKPKGDVKKTFYKFIGKTSSRMKSIWMKKMLSGEGTPPESLVDEAEMLKRVSTTPGAIGFISSDIAGSEVKILRLININTGD